VGLLDHGMPVIRQYVQNINVCPIAAYSRLHSLSRTLVSSDVGIGLYSW